jgi:phosphate transport system protein
MSTGGHTLKKFDEDLSALRDLVLRMGGTVEEQVAGAVAALQQGDVAAARAIAKRDRDIDRMELRADEEVAQLLALRAPLGVDLRTVLMLSKTVTDLERVGDEAKKIAKATVRIHEAVSSAREIPLLAAAVALAQGALAMLRGALDALVRLDLERAAALDAEDDRLDADYKAALEQLKAWMAEHPAGIDVAVQLMFVMKGLERIGDHAKNIAEYLHYLVKGHDIRHPKANPHTP